MKAYGGGGIPPPFLTLALVGGDWSASRTGRFTPEERTPVTNGIGSWVGPRAGLNAVEKRKHSCPCRVSNPGRPISISSLFLKILPLKSFFNIFTFG
jgi:hypothetical protein